MSRSRTGRAVGAILVPTAMFCWEGYYAPAFAQGAQDYPVPSNAREAYGAIREGFVAPLEPRDGLRGPRYNVDPRETRIGAERAERSLRAPAFIGETDLRANSRTYWLDEDQFGFATPRALTTGGSIAYQSGYLSDFFQLRGALYTTQPLYANADAGLTETLARDGDQITTLGQVAGRVKLAGQEITVGRHLVRTPFINPYDVRMIPLTFEGVTLLPQDQHAPFGYMASYLTRYKPWDEGDFQSFSQGLGIAGQDEGVLITGARYSANGWNVGGSNYWINDALNTAYGEIDYLVRDGGDEDLQFRVGANILDQRTTGSDLIAGAPYNTYQLSARIVASYQGFVLTGAVSQTDDDASVQKPFGYSTSYTGMIITSFEQASVRGVLLQVSYDFGQIGLHGVKFHAAWGRGVGDVDFAANGGFADQEELDLRLVYAPLGGRLTGLRTEVEYIDWQVFNNRALPSDALREFRVIVNYAVPLL